MMKPTVGRIVHYKSFGSPGVYPQESRAAIITEVAPETDENLALAEVEHWGEEAKYLVSLCVLNPTGMHFREGVRWSPNGDAGTWNWPPRE